MKRAELTGKRFGRFIVLRFAGMNHRQNTTWECLCDCGRKKIVTACKLLQGLSKCSERCPAKQTLLPVDVTIPPQSKLIPLSRGKFAIIDEELYETISIWNWCAELNRNTWYAHRAVYLGGGRAHCKLQKIKMHRFVLGLETGSGGIVDHINGNGLDNRRCNLRLCQHSDNIQKGPHKKNKYGFLGISITKDSPHRPYRARISDNGKRIGLGNFATATEAAIAYNKAALELHGIHAHVNSEVL
jgi:hypothetical protein